MLCVLPPEKPKAGSVSYRPITPVPGSYKRRLKMPGRLDELEQYAIDVILERRHGIRPSLLRITLRLLSHLYLGLVQLRIYLYRTRILRDRQLGCLVISIGNLTVGGTGKTPVVEKFARALQKGGRRVAILSRGYKSVDRRRKKNLWEKILAQGPEIPPRVVS